jgi:sec-independent protein translocase protein TatB
MFDVGFSELVVIAIVALIFLGPKQLPEVARTAGRWLAKFRRFVSDVKQDFDRELQHADLSELHKLKQELEETRRTIEETSSRLVQQATIEPPSFVASPKVAEPVASTAPSIAPPAASAPAARKTRPSRQPKPTKKRVVPTKTNVTKAKSKKGRHGRSG